VTCGENAECLNTEGSYSCGCKSGFIRTGDNCTDLAMVVVTLAVSALVLTLIGILLPILLCLRILRYVFDDCNYC
jgi:hypothetical protein